MGFRERRRPRSSVGVPILISRPRSSQLGGLAKWASTITGCLNALGMAVGTTTGKGR